MEHELVIAKWSANVTHVNPGRRNNHELDWYSSFQQVECAYWVSTYTRATIVPINETNVMAKNIVDVCADRHSFDGGLQK